MVHWSGEFAKCALSRSCTWPGWPGVVSRSVSVSTTISGREDPGPLPLSGGKYEPCSAGWTIPSIARFRLNTQGKDLTKYNHSRYRLLSDSRLNKLRELLALLTLPATSSTDFARMTSARIRTRSCPRRSSLSFTPNSDVWVLGVILLNMITGQNPWQRTLLKDASFARFNHSMRRIMFPQLRNTILHFDRFFRPAEDNDHMN
ncbi:hypothetical protein C8Q76DRAFT_691241 [Earliella scabrosa]|nr:hypothetical protein C8Q76DRAFT_691241 [Earliella scabrosa]